MRCLECHRADCPGSGSRHHRRSLGHRGRRRLGRSPRPRYRRAASPAHHAGPCPFRVGHGCRRPRARCHRCCSGRCLCGSTNDPRGHTRAVSALSSRAPGGRGRRANGRGRFLPSARSSWFGPFAPMVIGQIRGRFRRAWYGGSAASDSYRPLNRRGHGRRLHGRVRHCIDLTTDRRHQHRRRIRLGCDRRLGFAPSGRRDRGAYRAASSGRRRASGARQIEASS